MMMVQIMNQIRQQQRRMMTIMKALLILMMLIVETIYLRVLFPIRNPSFLSSSSPSGSIDVDVNDERSLQDGSLLTFAPTSTPTDGLYQPPPIEFFKQKFADTSGFTPRFPPGRITLEGAIF